MKEAKLNHNPDSPKWSQATTPSPLILEFQAAHPNYRGFAKAFEYSDAQSTGTGYSFTFALANPTAAQSSWLHLDQLPVASSAPTDSPSSLGDTTPQAGEGNTSQVTQSTLTISFAAQGQPVSLDFQFSSPSESVSWARYVKELGAPLAPQEPAKAKLEELERALSVSTSGLVNFTYDYKEASVLTVFLWPTVENDFAAKPDGSVQRLQMLGQPPH